MRQSLREFTEAAETYLLEVILENRPGKRAGALRSLLYLLSIATAAQKPDAS